MTARWDRAGSSLSRSLSTCDRGDRAPQSGHQRAMGQRRTERCRRGSRAKRRPVHPERVPKAETRGSSTDGGCCTARPNRARTPSHVDRFQHGGDRARHYGVVTPDARRRSCHPPSTSTASRTAGAKKSTMKPSSTTCRRNLTPSWLARSARHSFSSEGVGAVRCSCAYCASVATRRGDGDFSLGLLAGGMSQPSAGSMTRASDLKCTMVLRAAWSVRNWRCRPPADPRSNGSHRCAANHVQRPSREVRSCQYPRVPHVRRSRRLGAPARAQRSEHARAVPQRTGQPHRRLHQRPARPRPRPRSAGAPTRVPCPNK